MGCASAPVASEQRRRGLRGRDDHRDQQRQREQGHEQVARAGLDGERADQRADHGHAGVGQDEHEDEARDCAEARRRAEQQQCERGHGDDLQRDEEGEQAQRLGDEQRRAVDGRQQEAVEPALLVVCDEQAAGPEHRREQQRHPQHAGGEVAVDLPALQREMEDDERRDAEQRHRGHGLRRAQLQAQLLAQQGADGAHHRYSAPICSASTSAAAPDQRGAPGAQPECEVGLGQAAGRVVAGHDARAPARRPDERLDQLGRGRIEVGARLVEQQHLGVVQHRAADGQALHHPA